MSKGGKKRRRLAAEQQANAGNSAAVGRGGATPAAVKKKDGGHGATLPGHAAATAAATARPVAQLGSGVGGAGPAGFTALRKRKQGQRYWDSMAKKYDTEIYDSLHESMNSSAVLKLLDAAADKAAFCVDYGCGVGKYLSALSERFGSVLGTDLSQSLLDKAAETVVWSGTGRSRCRRLKNVKLVQADLSTRFTVDRPAQFGICQNVLLEPDRKVVEGILQNIHKTMAPDAKLMLLVPALESALHVGQTLPTLLQKGMASTPDCDPILGYLPREGILTQHFLREQIQLLLRQEGFNMLSIEKLEYGWSHEFGDIDITVPEDLPPWDWLILCQKTTLP